MSRRRFVKESAAITAAVGAVGLKRAGSMESGGRSRAIRLGGPVGAKSDDPEEVALAHRKLNYRGAYCPKVGLNEPDRIKAIMKAFARHDVVIAEVGRWCNLLDADPGKRKANLKRVTDGLALADEIGALCCVDIAGSFSTEQWYGPHPKNLSREFFDAAVENARKIVDAVKPKRAKFCYEMMGWALPDSVEAYLRMIEAVERKAFAVHLDPCNLINCPERFFNNTAVLNECFDKLGPWIVSCHAKDLKWNVEMNVHFVEVRPGTGTLDYTTFLKRLAALPNDAPLMMEHLPNAEEYEKARRYLLELGPKVGVSFG